MRSPEAAVVLIIYTLDLSPYEKISLQQCLEVFKNRPLIIVKPNSLSVSDLDLNGNILLENFPDMDFSNPGTYSRLLLSRGFYERFIGYQYILIVQLDAFVFKDELDKWCSGNFDYLGAPWFENFSSKEGEGDFIGVGNGGLSLRKVETHLKVLNTFSFLLSPRENWLNRKKQHLRGLQWIKHSAGFFLDYTIRNNTHYLFNSYGGHEDQFWGLSVAKKLDWFKVPQYEEAAAFAFEMQPHRLYALNNNQLPFGCHAWWKYDLEFWRPHIEHFGYSLSDTE